jgi:hypothetical protein
MMYHRGLLFALPALALTDPASAISAASKLSQSVSLTSFFFGFPVPSSFNPGSVSTEDEDDARAKCVADCAEKHPDLGPAYDACVAGCPLQILGIQPATNAMYPPVPPEFVQQAVDAALEIHALSVTNPGTPEIAVRLGEFYLKSYKSERLRVRFTEPFFLNSLVDLAIEPEITPELSEHLQDLVLFVINDGEFVERPAAFRAGMLALARNLASTSEDAGQVEAIILSQDLWEEVEEVGLALARTPSR